MSIVQQDFDQFMKQAQTRLVGASNAEIKAVLFNVFAEFFNDSSSWWESVAVPVLPTVLDYDLTVSEGQIVRLAQLTDATGFPIAAAMPVVGTLHVDHAPNKPETWYAVVIKTVVLPTAKDMLPVAPDWALPLWHVGILDGVLGNMMSQQNRSYSNERLSAYHLRRFRDAIARARVSTLRANSHGTQAWRFPQSFSSRSQRGGVPSFSGTERSF